MMFQTMCCWLGLHAWLYFNHSRVCDHCYKRETHLIKPIAGFFTLPPASQGGLEHPARSSKEQRSKARIDNT